MKIVWKRGNRSVEFERQPMPPERFTALCKLAGGVIAGVVLLIAIHLIGVRAAVISLLALMAIGAYHLVKHGLD